MKPRTLSIGGATYDLFVRTSANLPVDENQKSLLLPLGGKLRVESVIETCGGGASNSSVGLARLGCQASFCGIVGDDQWGERLLQNLKKEGVDTAPTTIVTGETSSFSVILSVGGSATTAHRGERVILYDPGTNAHLHDITFDKEHAGTVEWIYLNHLHEESCEIQDDMAQVFEGQNPPGLTWNPGGCQIEVGLDAQGNRRLMKHCKLLLLNKEEALAFSQTKTMEEALVKLLEAGAGVVCITDGGNGSYGATNGSSLVRSSLLDKNQKRATSNELTSNKLQSFHCSVLSTDVIDATGAGDAFGVGATWAVLSSLPLPEILRAGTINAASVVGSIGAQAGLLTDTDMRKRLQTVRLEVKEISIEPGQQLTINS